MWSSLENYKGNITRNIQTEQPKRVFEMQLVGVILLLISIGTIVGPVGAVVYLNKDNLTQLIVPPEISQIINGNIIAVNDATGADQSVLAPVFVGAQINNVSRTFTVTVNFTNTFNYTLTLKDLSATVVCVDHNYPLGNISLQNITEIHPGETTQITVTGAWTQNAENHVITEHPNATSINVNLTNLTINVNDITIQQNEPISIGNIPIT